jgi:predicted Zn-dependent protease
VFQAVKSWFDRSRAIREMDANERKSSEGFEEYFEDQLILAKESFDSGNREQAVLILSNMQRRYPKLSRLSKRRLLLLLDLGAFDEAEAWVQQGRRRYPFYRLYARGYLQVAHRRGDLEETLRRCELIRTKFPNIAEGYSLATDCLMKTGRDQEAEAMLEAATRAFPDEPELHIQHAHNAAQRLDWTEALNRWEVVRSRFDNRFLGWLGVTHSLKELGRFDEAEKIVIETRERFYRVEWFAVEWAEIAAARGDLVEAAERWKSLLNRSPAFVVATLRGAEALRKIGRDAEADEVLTNGTVRMRSELSVHLAYAKSAEHSGDQTEAAKRWVLVRKRFPDCSEAREKVAKAASAT